MDVGVWPQPPNAAGDGAAILRRSRFAQWRLSALAEVLGEHALGINRNESPLPSRQDLAALVEYLGGIDVPASAHAQLPTFDSQRFAQRNRLQILDLNVFGQRDHLADLVHLAHGFVKNGGDDATVRVSGRSGVALAETEATDEALPCLVVGKLQVHAVGIAVATSEAEIFRLVGMVAAAVRFLHRELFHHRGHRGHSGKQKQTKTKRLTTKDTKDHEVKNKIWQKPRFPSWHFVSLVVKLFFLCDSVSSVVSHFLPRNSARPRSRKVSR